MNVINIKWFLYFIFMYIVIRNLNIEYNIILFDMVWKKKWFLIVNICVYIKVIFLMIVFNNFI